MQKSAIKKNFFSRPRVNFTNILRAAFAPKSFCQKITNPNWKLIKAAQRTFVWLSMLLIFYEQLFHTKVLWAAFISFQFRFVIFWRKDFGAKAALKMLVKLIPLLKNWIEFLFSFLSGMFTSQILQICLLFAFTFALAAATRQQYYKSFFFFFTEAVGIKLDRFSLAQSFQTCMVRSCNGRNKGTLKCTSDIRQACLRHTKDKRCSLFVTTWVTYKNKLEYLSLIRLFNLTQSSGRLQRVARDKQSSLFIFIVSMV